MKEILSILLTVAGGLGVFLLGMKHLSEGLQAVSGSGLRRFMAATTTHRLAGIATGCISTIIVQSSSIITVMAVGFVSSGLLNLSQAINVIIGSNIGTTATAWLIASIPDVGILGLSIVAIGAIFYFFFNKEFPHNIGLALMGLGLIFMGLYWMNAGVAPIKTHASIKQAFATLDAGTFWGLAKTFFASLVFTAIVQSSAATTAIAMTLATQQIITFETAAATVFGMNIGTTVTAWLAALGGTKEGRQTALAHTLFNVLGTIIILPFFIPIILPVTKEMFPNWASLPATPMAAIHTAFNIITTLMFLPFVKPFARLISRLVPIKSDTKVSERPALKYIDEHIRLSPQIATTQAFSEVCFMSSTNKELLVSLRALISGEESLKNEEFVTDNERLLDKVQREITEFLGKVMRSRLPVAVADQARSLLRIIDELESISDEACVIVKSMRRTRENGGLEEKDLNTILDIHQKISFFSNIIDSSLKCCESKMGEKPVENAQSIRSEIRALVRNARQEALMAAGCGERAALHTLSKLDVLNAYDRMCGYYMNIAETISFARK